MKRLILPSLLAVLISGCVSPTTPFIQNQKTAFPQPATVTEYGGTVQSAINTQKPERSPTITNTSPIPTANIPTTTSTITSTTTIAVPESTCRPRELASQPGLISEGKIIFMEEGSNKLFSLSPNESEFVPFLPDLEDGTRFCAASPDQKWLAISNERYTKQRTVAGVDLVLTTANGKEIKTMPWDKNWTAPFDRWLDDSRLIMIPINEDPLGTIVLVNPFTRQHRAMVPSFPGLFDPSWGPHTLMWESWAYIVYDPTLSRAVYLYEKKGENTIERSLVLWNLETNREVRRIPVSDVEQVQMPVWAPDGKQFVVVVPVADPLKGFQVLFVSRDGEVKEVTNPAIPMPPEMVEVEGWSPDAQYVSFWSFTPQWSEPVNEKRLLLLNVKEQELIDYCITSPKYNPFLFAPVWSPDSRQFIIKVVYKVPKFSSLLVKNISYNLLVDIASGKVVQFDYELSPVGWLRTDP